MKVNHYRPTYRQPGNAAFQLDSQQLDLRATQPKPQGMMDLVKELTQWEQGERVQKAQVRWHVEAMPIRVHLAAPDSGEMALKPEKLLASVLKDWEAASLGQVRFQVSPTAHGADITLCWSDETVLGRDFEVGHTHRRVVPAGESQGWIRGAEITLMRQPLIDHHLSPERQLKRLRATLLHEMGHALGLEHAHSAADVMHHRGWKNAFLSPNDCRAIQTLYRPAPRNA